MNIRRFGIVFLALATLLLGGCKDGIYIFSNEEQHDIYVVCEEHHCRGLQLALEATAEVLDIRFHVPGGLSAWHTDEHNVTRLAVISLDGISNGDYPTVTITTNGPATLENIHQVILAGYEPAPLQVIDITKLRTEILRQSVE